MLFGIRLLSDCAAAMQYIQAGSVMRERTKCMDFQGDCLSGGCPDTPTVQGTRTMCVSLAFYYRAYLSEKISVQILLLDFSGWWRYSMSLTGDDFLERGDEMDFLQNLSRGRRDSEAGGEGAIWNLQRA